MKFLFLWEIKIYLVRQLGQLRNRGGFALVSVFFSAKQSRCQSNIIINICILFLVVVADSVMCYNNCGA